MSKREILMVRDNACLRPYGDAAWEDFGQIRTTKPVLVSVHQARNPDHHAKLFAIAAKVADHCADFADAEDAIEWAKLHIPHMRKYHKRIDGTVVVTTKSISYASMDQLAFARFYDRALYMWAEKIGADPETLLAEASQTA